MPERELFMETHGIRAFTRLAALAALAVAATGCGAHYNRAPQSTDTAESGLSSAASASSGDEWRCPAAGVYNIKAPYGTVQSDMAFTACKSANGDGKVLIKGYSQNSSTVCVYPLIRSGDGAGFSIADRRKCYNVSSGSAVAQFTEATNYLIIVESQYTNAMEQCGLGILSYTLRMGTDGSYLGLGTALSPSSHLHCPSSVEGAL